MKTAMAILALALLLVGHHARACEPWAAYATRVDYVAVGRNTSVELVTYCRYGAARWYVSYFEGHPEDGAQPDLRQWAEIQNTASRLLRGE